MNYSIGIDIGSTTLKYVVMSESGDIVMKNYERHYSRVKEKCLEVLDNIKSTFNKDCRFHIAISGSAALGFAERLGVGFTQEVYATRAAVKKYIPDADVVIELGGEDAKILFVSGATEVRMNGSCAGGTGAFIDQMASLLKCDAGEMDTLAENYNKIYSIASRCGVFAKSDIQPLLNQGARREDIAASIFAAVVNQTIAGLAQGRVIEGNVVYLGGPLTFLSQLRNAFDRAIGTKGICPENSLYFVAMGAAILSTEETDIDDLIRRIESLDSLGAYQGCDPLFASEEEYADFCTRHNSDGYDKLNSIGSDGKAYLGIDAGSTTIKAVLLNSDKEIIYTKYLSNSGNPVPVVKNILHEIYSKFPGINIVSSASTGYGEEIIKHAFHLDCGIVETIAHFTAAKKFDPDVDFIIDIGGQDIKCFKIHGGAIDNIFLNEACSSGCGSFLQTFAGAIGYAMEDFAKLGLFADRPVDLGSRCTVFMNSSVKQAQKDGASVENISAGLSISVVKNALYKVIRARSAEDTGNHIVVQGGTFLNDAVLRAFETEIGRNVIRPTISGLMGAFGAALYAADVKSDGDSSIITPEALNNFTHEVKAITCQGCTNHCRLTVNTFDDGSKYIGGNQCDKPVSGGNQKEKYSLYEYKRELLAEYGSVEGSRGVTVGIPMGLNMYELLPFWHKLFTELGFGVKISPPSSKKLYVRGQNSIPSDTVCYPAKLMHGHVQALIDDGADTIFYPCMSYNLDEGLGDNHYNCPVVAYYPEVISGNMKSLANVKFIKDYVGIHNCKAFPKKFHDVIRKSLDPGVTLKEVKRAADAAYTEYGSYMAKICLKGDEYLRLAKEKGMPVIVLCGRPYHLDPEISHGIDKFICECGAVLISEDALVDKYEKHPRTVLNQWTYHSRMYAAAEYVAASGDPAINLVQLVSFGCGVDAITTDEMRTILEKHGGKIYTQIKIDEITNLGAVKIRLRSLFAALEQKRSNVDE